MSPKKDSPILFPNEDYVNSILTDKEISEYASVGKLISSNHYSENCLEASSYDIRVGAKGCCRMRRK